MTPGEKVVDVKNSDDIVLRLVKEIDEPDVGKYEKKKR